MANRYDFTITRFLPVALVAATAFATTAILAQPIAFMNAVAFALTGLCG